MLEPISRIRSRNVNVEKGGFGTEEIVKVCH